jgi:hypothetical protein
METNKQLVVVEMMHTEIATLESDLLAAKIDFANSSLDENDWQCKYERKMTCKMLEAQIAILRKIIKEIPLISAGKMALMSA